VHCFRAAEGIPSRECESPNSDPEREPPSREWRERDERRRRMRWTDDEWVSTGPGPCSS
jgi:hypothetical protein